MPIPLPRRISRGRRDARYNSAVYLSQEDVVHVHRKLFLPTDLNWEERKHVSPGQSTRAFYSAWARTATLICNDAWQPALPWLAAARRTSVPACSTRWSIGTTCSSTSPACSSAGRVVNRVGTEAGVRFWGGSRVIDPSGEIIAQAPFWEPALITGHLSMAENAWLLPVARAGGVRRLLITHRGHTVSVTTG